MAFDFLEQFDTRDTRHADIGNNQVEILHRDHAQGSLGIVRFEHLKVLLLQNDADELADLHLIVDHQYVPAVGRSVARNCACFRGLN